MTKPRIIVVLGMHRSGTSAITRGLKALSVELGDNLMRPVPGNNDKGFWEDMDLYRLNERLLFKAGSDWDRLSLVDAEAYCREAYTEERYEAAALIERKLANTSVFGFKDPRTAIVLPFWKCIFEDLGIDDRYVIALRNPLEVAESLRKRDQFETTYGLLLWAKYTWATLVHSTDKNRLCVSYQNLMEDPAGQLQRMSEAFDLPLPGVTDPMFMEYVGDFLTPDLRHNRISQNELRRSINIPEIVEPLYNQLTEWASKPATEDLNISNAVSAKVEAFWECSQPLLLLGDQLKARAKKITLEAAKTEAARAETDKALEASKAALSEKEKFIAELSKREADLQQQTTQALEASKAKLIEKEKFIAELSKREADLQQQTTQALEASKAKLIEKEQYITELSKNKADLQQQTTHALEASKAKLIEKEQYITELSKNKADLQQQITLVTASDVEARRKLNELVDVEQNIKKQLASVEADKRAQATKLSDQEKIILALTANETQLKTQLSDALASATKLTLAEDQLRERISENTRLVHTLEEINASFEAQSIQLMDTKAALEISEQRSGKLFSEIQILVKRQKTAEAQYKHIEQKLKQAQAAETSNQLKTQKAEKELAVAIASSAAINIQLQTLQADLAEKTKTLRLLRHEIVELRSSTSWRLTKPIRSTKSLLTRSGSALKRLIAKDA